ncbi:hypothetical protein [Candidatus Tremblaya phenacola]|uniref:Uncharacterized protein n=1 Tax=Candidatus Tremblayella phenacoccinincola TaxID=1010676 RepID=A0A2G0V705_9PROT|nr:hypothetical protein [Candidatus Tremblaya phenacola]PHN16240.1 hypothetical protein TPPER_00169 [Candidatus Tremblaya phenacola]
MYEANEANETMNRLTAEHTTAFHPNLLRDTFPTESSHTYSLTNILFCLLLTLTPLPTIQNHLLIIPEINPEHPYVLPRYCLTSLSPTPNP